MAKPRPTPPRSHADSRLAAIEGALRELAKLVRRSVSPPCRGLTADAWRDLVAVVAMHKLLERIHDDGRHLAVETIARIAYDQAIAMLAERNQAPTT